LVLQGPNRSRKFGNYETPARLLLVLPVALVAVVACVLAWRERGSFAPGDWMGYAALVALVLAVVLFGGRARRPSTALLVGVACLLGLAVWDAISITWSPVPSMARDEALLVAFYALVLVLPSLTLPADGRRAAALVVVAGLAVVAVGAAVALLLESHPGDDAPGGRLVFPISYVNGQAAFFLAGFWPALAFAARREESVAIRIVALGAAEAFLAGWLLTESKGGLVGLGASAVVVLAVAAERLRLLVPAALVAAVVAVAYRPLTAPFRASEDGLDDAVRSASRTMLVCVAVALALGAAYVAIDRRLSLGPRVTRAGNVALAAVVAVAVLAGAAAFFATVDKPVRFVERKWDSFKRLPDTEQGSSHLATLGSNRYDFWRVDLDEFVDHPVAGIGARGFWTAYLLHRRSDESPRRGHSVFLDVLAETGLIGLLLLVGGLGGALLAAFRGARSLLGAALLGAGVYWIVHAAVDWIWTLPAVGLPFFLLLGIGAATGERPYLPSRASLAAGAAAVLLAVLAFAPPWLSARYTEQALGGASDSSAALRRARRLDPLSTDPLVAEATLARSPDDIAPLRRAVDKEPRRSDLHLLLARAYARAGRTADARRQLLAARRLDPRGRALTLR
jgi:O-antigen ligase